MPGPTSKIILSLISSMEEILLITFLSIKNFVLNFFCSYHLLSKNFIALVKLSGLDKFLPAI